ncbi:MAG: TVP38/TMEM64 family protein [Nitrospirae bacterium]|nr:TVP38/TMEM64 family protein [Candidatus Manganitrophaceae bacterium]
MNNLNISDDPSTQKRNETFLEQPEDAQEPALTCPSKENHFLDRKRLIMIVFFLVSVFWFFYLRRQGYIRAEYLLVYLESHPTLAPVLFILLYGILPVFFLPTLPLNLGAGFLWGPWLGSFLAILGAAMGASLAFLSSRYLVGGYFKEQFKQPIWNRLKEGIDKQGWKAVAFTRIAPIFPFGPLNYFWGITPIPFRRYVWVSAVFMTPPIILFSFLGYSVGDLVLKEESYDFTKHVFLLSGAAGLLVFVRVMIKRFFKKKESELS